MLEQPLVSVCFITYNHAKYVRQALDSVLMQETSFPYEICIGEDESNDGTREICIEYKKIYPDKIKLFLRCREDVIYINGQPTGRFNLIKTLESCRGEYIALLEGDDYWTDPLKLQKQVEILEKNKNFSICFHNMQIIDENNPNQNRISNSNQKQISSLKDLARNNYIYTASCIFRNNLKGKFPEWFLSLPVGDYPLHLINAQHGDIYYIDELMGTYRVHDKGIWEYRDEAYRYFHWIKMIDILKNKFSHETNYILTRQKYNLMKYFLSDYDRYKKFIELDGRFNKNYICYLDRYLIKLKNLIIIHYLKLKYHK